MVRAPVSERRLEILQWLEHAPAPFPSDGDPSPGGVTADAIAVALGVPPSLLQCDLALLTRVGLVRAHQAGPHTYYRRDEVRMAEVARMFEKGW
ncbi:winged helix-turn-helix domain-containing protein [Streptomyces sp. NPDC049915]|uniref:ArsR/SmtB family transcription factor n=1 Tax=Streptomyces sp. NPDC049915 TaxID=3155510 RepID=UPI00343D8AF4